MNLLNKNMKVCFYARSINAQFFAYAGKKLEEQGIDTCYITDRKNEVEILNKAECNNKQYNLIEYIKKNWNNESLLNSIDLTDIEKTYKIESLWNILYVDRFLTYSTLEDTIKFMKLHILFYLEIIQVEKPQYFIYENISHFSAYIFYLLGKHHNIRYIGFSESRNYADKKFTFTNNEHQNNYLLDNYYSIGITKNEIEAAEQFIKTYRKTKPKPEYMNIYGNKPSLNFQILKGIIRYPFYLFKKKDYLHYTEYYDQEKSPLRKLKHYLKYQYHKHFFQDSRINDKFYLFTLHFQPEATTLVNANNYEKQLYAIDLIAKKIPVNSILYVKEHYADLGHRELFFYNKLKQYPNVRLINPWENSRNLIEKSLGVIALSGTVGWEAILLRKPVFLLGNMFYSTFKYTNKVENINDLTFQINNHKLLKLDKKTYDDELITYVGAYIKSLQNGSYICYGSTINIQEENKKALYQSLFNELERLQHN